MNTVSITVTVSESNRESLFAFLSDFPIEGIEESDDDLKLFFLEKNWSQSTEEDLDAFLSGAGVNTNTQIRIIEPRNWNKEWEEDLRPVTVGPFYISPDASPPISLDDRVVLSIRPQMSFGTGYHESTRLALRHLAVTPVTGLRVLDAGTGTGILAIGAAKMGAAEVVAFDSDPWAYRNGLDNVGANRVSDKITLIEGTLDDISGGDFDVILANINRKVLLDTIPHFSDRLTSGGKLILSGLLESDQGPIRDALQRSHLVVASEFVEGEWWSPRTVHISRSKPIKHVD